MSEKKAPEKKEKEKLVHVTEEQLKAGKEEIMKIVNGQPGAEKLGEMLDKGRKKGRLSSNELMDALEEMDLESEQMDRIYDVLENMGIDTAGEDYLPDLTDGDMPPIEEIEEIPEEEIVDPNTLVDSFGIDDPVRMYLKEIGKVDLLSSLVLLDRNGDPLMPNEAAAASNTEPCQIFFTFSSPLMVDQVCTIQIGTLTGTLSSP